MLVRGETVVIFDIDKDWPHCHFLWVRLSKLSVFADPAGFSSARKIVICVEHYQPHENMKEGSQTILAYMLVGATDCLLYYICYG